MRPVLRLRFLAALLGLISVTASAAPFADTVNHPFVWQIDKLRTNGIVRGYNASIFRPDNPINRAEFLKILMLAVFGEETLTVENRRCFPDFYGQEQWFWIYACAAKERGIVEGYPDGSFGGLTYVNTAEALKMAIQTWQLPLPFYIRPPDNWYDPYVDVASERGVWNLLPRFPGHYLSRGEMAAMMVALGEEIAVMPIDDYPVEEEEPPEIVYQPDPVWEPEPEDPEWEEGDEFEDPAFEEDPEFEDPDFEEDPGFEEPEFEEPVPSSPPTSPRPVCGNGRREAGEECDDGNLTNGDGCSQICVVVPEPVRHAALRIEQKGQGSSSQAQGTKDIPLFGFTAVAGRQDARLTTITFIALAGSLKNVKQYRLLVDTNGDGRAEKLIATGRVDGTKLLFTGMTHVLPAGRLTTFEIRADLVATAGSSTSVQLGFATSDSRYVEAIGMKDGRDLSGIETNNADCGESVCWIAVHTADAQVVSVGQAGNLYVRKDSAPTGSHQVLLGDEGTHALLHINFTAQGEDIAITALNIGGGTPSIDHLEFYEEEGGEEYFADAFASACAEPAAGKFCVREAQGFFTIPEGQEVDVYVYAVLKTDASGGTSGDTAAFTLSASASDIAVAAYGEDSRQLLTQSDGDSTAEGEIFIGRNSPGPNIAIVGSTHDFVGAMIDGIENASAEPDNTPVPLGVQPFAAFRFSAAAHTNTRNGLDDVTITDLEFTVSAINVSLDSDSIELFNVDDPSDSISCTADRSTGTITVSCNDLDASVVSTVIEQGGFLDLALMGEIALIDAAGSHTLQASLNGLGDRSRPGTVVWEDDSFPFDWVDAGESQVKGTLYKTP